MNKFTKDFIINDTKNHVWMDSMWDTMSHSGENVRKWKKGYYIQPLRVNQSYQNNMI